MRNEGMIKLVVFDLDGTLVDSKKIYVDTVQEVLASHSLKFPKYKISRAMGPKLGQTLLNLTNFEPSMLRRLKDEINPIVEQKSSELKLCPYTKEVLTRLKKEKYTIILMTNSTHKYLSATLKKNKISQFFKEVLGAEDFLNKETAFHALFKKYHVKPNETLYVGDRRSDFAIAKDVGCQIVLVKSRSWDKTEISTNRDYRKVLVNDLRGVICSIEAPKSPSGIYI